MGLSTEDAEHQGKSRKLNNFVQKWYNISVTKNQNKSKTIGVNHDDKVQHSWFISYFFVLHIR